MELAGVHPERVCFWSIVGAGFMPARTTGRDSDIFREGMNPIRIKLRPSARKFPPSGGNHGSRGVSLMRMG